MSRFSLSPQADRDVEAYVFHIGKDKPAAARRFLESATRTFQELADSPHFGSLYAAPPPGLEGLRVWRVRAHRNYLVFYRPIEDGVDIIRVIHGARDWDALIEATTS